MWRRIIAPNSLHNLVYVSRRIPDTSTFRIEDDPMLADQFENSAGLVCRQHLMLVNMLRTVKLTSPMSVVKWSRSAFFATSSGRPGSWIGTSPRASDSTFSWTM